jgi:hypothetical protein
MLWETLGLGIPVLLAGLGVFFRSRFKSHSAAISAIEAGVLHAWKEFGRDRKQKLKEEEADPGNERKNSKFEAADIATLKNLAVDAAKDVTKKVTGRDLENILNPAMWDLEIEKAVNRVKNK